MAEPQVRAVVFDLDGTLIDSKDVMRHAYLQAYEEVVGEGEAPPFSDYCKYLGRSFPEIMRLMGLPLAMQPVFVRESIRQMHRIAVFDGVRPMLQALSRRRIPMAIATGKDRARTRQILDHLALSDHFAMVVGSDDVSAPKPAPEMALTIARTLRLDCASTLFVGDSMADLACGRSAGMRTGLATWDDPGPEARGVDHAIHLHHPNDVLHLL
ncbi:HAD-IA family hydrolase [Roseateles amylovorans]|uniref:phosphoglycolate phosphatase n=1 Tax=Roseateles amylovorans TaxID=2978473 RepID=A0ABY6AT53_9BURK|nr:HAD-IA family hydrolase [Roseateles amylovorans]UXH76103.1 HAD-IA family hydrolase [Roseateles amylovorans]